MPVLIKMPNDGENYAMIELQGDINSHTNSKFNGSFIGDLHLTKSGTPILIIGHHLMFGKEETIEKPLALLHRVRKEEESTEYLVKAVISKKIIFKTRPKPIVGSQT